MEEKKKAIEKKNPAARRRLILVIVSAVLCYGVLLLGIILNKSLGLPARTVSVLLAVLGAAPVVLTLLFRLVGFVVGKKLVQMGENVAEMQKFLQSHRENAEESARKELACLLRIRFFTKLWAFFLGLSALGFAFAAGCSRMVVELNLPYAFYAALLFYVSLSELLRSAGRKISEAGDNALTEEDYPALYALAKKAQARVGGKEKIRIAWFDEAESPVGVAVYGDTVSIYIDVVILNLLTEEELYAVLLHEFAHVDSSNAKDKAVNSYMQCLVENQGDHGVFAGAEILAYLLFRDLFAYHHMLYLFAASIEKECYADSVMKECPLSAATGLLKTHYYAMYYEERATDDSIEPAFLPETPPEAYYTAILAHFRQSLDRQRDFWNSLIEKEILSRSASHPLISSRIRSLGFEALPPVTVFPEGEWQKTGEKALCAANAAIRDSFGKDCPSYEEQRKANYLAPLSRVTAWEEKGRPITAEDYADVMAAMLQIGRTQEALDLAERAINELPASASHTAYFQRGRIRLGRYDPAGLEDIYAAMEENNNYIEEGLDLIGDFCCRMGMQEELDTYREKALTFLQKYQDESAQIGEISKKDDLSVEHLPDGALEGVLAYINSVSEGKVEKVYLFRKTVSESFFASTFVLKFLLDTDEEKRYEIYHHVFRYLDTSSDWQYSLYEFEDIPAGILDQKPEYLVWRKDEEQE